jgi:hypothetical protein
VDIVIQTNTENPYLAFRDLVRFEDDSGYHTKLTVRSGWLSANYDFNFETRCLSDFISALEQIDRTLVGAARLKPVYEDQFIEFRGDGRGGILIFGCLIDRGGMEQRLQFAFNTDQTCLAALIRGLRQAA